MIRDIFVYTMWHICGKELNRTLSEEVLWALSVEMKKTTTTKWKRVIAVYQSVILTTPVATKQRSK